MLYSKSTGFFLWLGKLLSSLVALFPADIAQYFFQGYEKSIIDASRNIGCISLQSSNWFYDCLAFYDLVWSTTAALNQLCMVRRHLRRAQNTLSSLDKARETRDFQLVLSTRCQLRKQLYLSSEEAQGNWAAVQFIALILQDMRLDCAEERCQCFESDSSIIHEMVRHSRGLSTC